MNKVVIDKKICSTYDGYYTLLEYLSDSKFICKSYEEVKFDFSENREFDINLFAIIVAIAYETKKNGYDFTITKVKNANLKRKWQEYNRFDNLTVLENNIPFKEFAPDLHLDFDQYINEYVYKYVSKMMSDRLGSNIKSNLGEIFGNVETHTESEKVFCCGQINDEKLDFTIVNLGITIRETVDNYTERNNIKNISNPIPWAVAEGNTTKISTGGFGLHLLKEFISKNNGKFQIISGDDYYEWTGEEKNDVFNHFFPGTIVNVEFNLTDKSKYRLKNEDFNINDLF
ncbi:MAG: hypothetical protein R3Y09_02295 [Clostridia bacterium]